MRIPPLFSRKPVFGDRIFEIDCRFRNFESSPINDILGKMVFMVKSHQNPKVEKPGGLIGRNLIKKQGDL